MKRMSQVLCGAAIMVMAGTAISPVHARALFAYPMQGQSQSRRTQIAQPVTIGPSFRAGTIPRLCMQPSEAIIITQSGNTLPTYDRRYPAPGGIATSQGERRHPPPK